MIWLNGGPGCSSLLGLLNENGPFVFEEEDNLISTNPFSWNREANLLFFEQPAGVFELKILN